MGAGFDADRQAAVQEVTPQAWEEWREQARRIKAHTLAHLDYYLEMLHDNVVKSGGRVHFASDAAQANDIVAGTGPDSPSASRRQEQVNGVRRTGP